MATAKQREQIRGLYDKEGGLLSIRHLAALVLKSSILSDDERHAMLLRGAESLCRRALVERDAAGLPYAQPVESEPDEDDEDGVAQSPLWLRLELHDRPQWFKLIKRRVTEVDRDYEMLLKLWKACRERFGDAPEIPNLS